MNQHVENANREMQMRDGQRRRIFDVFGEMSRKGEETATTANALVRDLPDALSEIRSEQMLLRPDTVEAQWFSGDQRDGIRIIGESRRTQQRAGRFGPTQ